MIADDRKSVLDALAERLASAWQTASVIGAIAPEDIPRSRIESYYTQDRMADVIAQEVTGWKVGATTAPMREKDAHEDIIPGRLFSSSTVFSHAATVKIGDCPNPRVEPEFGFRLNADIPIRGTEWTVAEVAPLMTLHPSIEVIGTRFTMPGAEKRDLSRLSVADNGVCIAGVFGEAIEDWQALDFATHTVTLTIDGGDPVPNLPPDLRCDPREVVANLANLLAKRGLWLRAGDMLLTGTATMPEPVRVGSLMVADYGALGRIEIEFE